MHLDIFSYLYYEKDEIIVLLKEQLQLANEQLQQANATVSSLTTQVSELIERIKSLEELLVQKGIAIDKANRQNKALGKLVSGKVRTAGKESTRLDDPGGI